MATSGGEDFRCKGNGIVAGTCMVRLFKAQRKDQASRQNTELLSKLRENWLFPVAHLVNSSC